MKPGWLTAMTLATAAAALGTTGGCKPTVLVTMQNGTLVDAVVLAMAEATTARVFAQVGVRAAWTLGGGAALLPCTERMEIVLDAEAPGRFSPTAMAYATVGESGTAIHVFVNRVLQGHTRSLGPTLLGHVFAHEMVHVLENVPRHSEFGILKANWVRDDFDTMAMHPLPFAPEDAAMVRAAFGL
jgi:hypothetical protein